MVILSFSGGLPTKEFTPVLVLCWTSNSSAFHQEHPQFITFVVIPLLGRIYLSHGLLFSLQLIVLPFRRSEVHFFYAIVLFKADKEKLGP
jgi:hypothetical protein